MKTKSSEIFSRHPRAWSVAILFVSSACASSTDGTPPAGTGGTATGNGGGPSATGGAPLVTGGAPVATGGTTTTGGAPVATGGATTTGGSPAGGHGGGPPIATGGAIAAGGASGGGTTATGGKNTGGAGGSAGMAGHDAGTGGNAGGRDGTAGSGGMAGAASGATGMSAGCGRTPALKNSPGTAANYNMVGSRRYILRYPENYDNKHPYRLIIAYHWLSGSASQVFDCTTESIRCYTTQSPFYGLWNLANNTTIFVAPDGLNAGWANTNGADITFTDDILKQVEADLCIDTTRIFANGFSYGGGMSKAVGCARADVFRGIAVYSGADFLSGCQGGTSPIAFYGSHATDDGTNMYSSGIQILNRFAKNNGCTGMTPPTPPNNGHTCVDFTGCSAGHPTRWCAFQGSNKHDPSPKDPGQSMTWNPAEAWKFITQF
jgi:poly(3-hydroxybutyrate) depolymerase